MKHLDQLLQTNVGRFGTFHLGLLILENTVDDNFFCPCKHDYNHAICFLYAFVPAIASLLGTLCFMDLDGIERIVYSLLNILTWLSLFFLDGRYLACAYSNWKGVYTKSDTLGIEKWCKPTGNETSEYRSQERTLELMAISQFTGFVLMIVVIGGFVLFKYCKRCKQEPLANTGAPEQPPPDEGVPLQSKQMPQEEQE
ncbi:hypothetical protein KOW79_021629 [Hemibagrus wyckioides]|uniref:Uncharacterized protein n=1 Tax=Hemibagrus wyckioides TaxID=337641 RepID=A0A9D3N1K7_9TELE|nr:hypothetical protein KOW79_021629 [Hemibagrus wyckioides]